MLKIRGGMLHRDDQGCIKEWLEKTLKSNNILEGRRVSTGLALLM